MAFDRRTVPIFIDSRVVGVDFYLYFPSVEGARNAASELRDEGFIVMPRDEIDKKGWQVLVHREVSDDELQVAEKRLEQVAESHGGTYDSFERD